MILVVLIVGLLLDRLLNAETRIFRTLIAYFYITNEGTSLLENCV
ncbi:putative holin (fragment) [Clostridium neonatale]